MDPRFLPQNVTDNLNAPSPSQAAMDALAQAQPTATDVAQPPQPGQAALVSPPAGSPPAGGPLVPPYGGASIFQQLKSKNSPALAALSAGMDKAAAADPKAAAQPGGWARAIVSGAQAMFGGVQGVLAGLGDAAAVGTVPSGGGALEGVSRTLAAKNQRLAEQDKSKLLTAEANIRMRHEQALIHQLDESSIQASIDAGTKTVDKLKNGPSPAAIIADGLTSDELTKYLSDKKIDPVKETAFPTGRRQVGENKDGTPIYRTTYTAMGLPQDVTLDEKDKDILDRLNKYSPPTEGKWKPGTTMSGSQFNWVMQAAADNEAATMARNKTLRDTEGGEQESIQKLEAVKFGPEWTNALANNGNDPLKAYDALMSNPELRGRYPHLDQDIRKAYPNMDKLEQEREKKRETSTDQLAGIDKALNTAHGEEAASIAAGLQTRLADSSTPADQKPRIQKMLNQANNQAKASLDFENKKKQQDEAIKNAIEEEDMPVLVQAANNYQLDPNKLYSMRKNTNAKFKAAMLTQDPTWSEAEYKSRYQTTQDFRPEGKGGLAVQSLNTFTGHVGDANDLISSLQNTRSPLLNEGLNIVKKQLGNDKVAPYIGALGAAGHEYINFLNNQHAKTEADEKLVAKLSDENTSPNTAQAVLRQMVQTVAIRGRNLNNSYKATMKKDYADMLSPESAQILRTFGIDTRGMGGVQGQTPEQTQQRLVNQTQQKPVSIVDPKSGHRLVLSADGKSWIDPTTGRPPAQ